MKTDDSRKRDPAGVDAGQRMVSCGDIQSLLFDYMTHELGDKQSWLVHEHLRHCAECRAEAAAIEKTLSILCSDRSAAGPEHLKSEMRRRLERAVLHPAWDWVYEHRRLVAAIMAVEVASSIPASVKAVLIFSSASLTCCCISSAVGVLISSTE